MPRVQEEYLGDGVYVSWDGWYVVLGTRGQFPNNTIYLEPEVWTRLLEWRIKFRAGEEGSNADNNG